MLVVFLKLKFDYVYTNHLIFLHSIRACFEWKVAVHTACNGIAVYKTRRFMLLFFHQWRMNDMGYANRIKMQVNISGHGELALLWKSRSILS